MEKNEIAATKKEPNYRGIKALPFIIGNEALGTIGTAANLLVYLTSVFNMTKIEAANVVTIFGAACNIGSLPGAFLSDTYLGRYKTIGIASVSSFLAMLVHTLTAYFPKLHPAKPCASEEHSSCIRPSAGQLGFLYGGFLLLVVGASGIKPCNLAFGVDQFNPNTDSGRKGINSFFGWYYFAYIFSAMISSTVIVYVQSNKGWAIGLGIPTLLMFLSCLFFFLGTGIYVKVLPEGSPLTNVVQTLAVAFKKRKLELPDQPWNSLFNHIPSDSINSKLAHTDKLRFLSKAAILTPEDDVNTDGSAAKPWRLRSLQQVEEIKCVVKVIPIWISGISYNIALNLIQTYVVFQARQSNRRIGRGKFNIPEASYSLFMMIGVTIWIPIYDRILVPILKRVPSKKEGLTILQRVGIGLVVGILATIVSGVVEHHRRILAVRDISSMSGNWLIPQLVIAGISQGLAITGSIEFFYKEFPENMRSLGPSFLYTGFAVSGVLSSFLISVVDHTTKARKKESWLANDLNQGRLDYFYYLLAGMEVVNLVCFVVSAKWYKYKVSDSSRVDDESMERS